MMTIKTHIIWVLVAFVFCSSAIGATNPSYPSQGDSPTQDDGTGLSRGGGSVSLPMNIEYSFDCPENKLRFNITYEDEPIDEVRLAIQSGIRYSDITYTGRDGLAVFEMRASGEYRLFATRRDYRMQEMWITISSLCNSPEDDVAFEDEYDVTEGFELEADAEEEPEPEVEEDTPGDETGNQSVYQEETVEPVTSGPSNVSNETEVDDAQADEAPDMGGSEEGSEFPYIGQSNQLWIIGLIILILAALAYYQMRQRNRG